MVSDSDKTYETRMADDLCLFMPLQSFTFSDFSREIGDSIMKELDISVTYMKTLGGYSRQEKILTYCVVNRLDMPKLKEVIHSVDPKAFIVTEDVHEVEGVRIKKKNH